MKTLADAAKETTVLYEADVVVIGGGPAGIGAALAAGRAGAKTVLIERFGHLGGAQTITYNDSFSFVDDHIQGGLVREFIDDLAAAGAIYADTDGLRRARWGHAQGCYYFDPEYYKLFLDRKMADAGVTVLYHAYAVDGILTGNTLRGVLAEGIEGRFAIGAKAVIDCTGMAEFAWKSGAGVTGDEGFGDNRYGHYKGFHGGYSYGLFLCNVDYERFRACALENPDEWNHWAKGKALIKKAKAEGSLYFYRRSMINNEYPDGRFWTLGPGYTCEKGKPLYDMKRVSAASMDLRRQTWSLWKLLKENVPGFAQAEVEQTPQHLLLRDVHRLAGRYELAECDMYSARSFEDSVVCSNMPPDIFFHDGDKYLQYNVTPYDVPYRSLVSKDYDNLLAAGASGSYDIIVWWALRYCVTSLCTGQAAGTAAAMAVQKGVSPRELDVAELQAELCRSKLVTTNRDLPAEVIAEYRARRETWKDAYELDPVVAY